MRIISNITELPRSFVGGSAVTIGNFDGVHLGHQRLVRLVTEYARNHALPSAVITFEPHPLRTMLGDAAPPLLMPLSRKLSCLASLGVDLTLVLPFTRETAGTSPEDFVRNVLVDGLHTRMLYVGYDYAFGKGRRGNAALLAQLGAEHGFSVERIDPVFAEGSIVSSTRIREKLQGGAVDEAAILLGRPHSIEGVVSHGMNRGGALLGFPTANLRAEQELLLPQPGVYAVLAESLPLNDTCLSSAELRANPSIFQGVANVGKNPTFDGSSLHVETHLLDFHADIYETPLRVHFIRRLRDERKFPDVDALKGQIGRDVAQARDILR